MANDTYHTKFSGEIRIHSHEWENSYEVWVNGKLLKSLDTFPQSVAFLSDYSHLFAQEEISKQILNWNRD